MLSTRPSSYCTIYSWCGLIAHATLQKGRNASTQLEDVDANGLRAHSLHSYYHFWWVDGSWNLTARRKTSSSFMQKALWDYSGSRHGHCSYIIMRASCRPLKLPSIRRSWLFYWLSWVYDGKKFNDENICNFTIRNCCRMPCESSPCGILSERWPGEHSLAFPFVRWCWYFRQAAQFRLTWRKIYLVSPISTKQKQILHKYKGTEKQNHWKYLRVYETPLPPVKIQFFRSCQLWKRLMQ